MRVCTVGENIPANNYNNVTYIVKLYNCALLIKFKDLETPSMFHQDL